MSGFKIFEIRMLIHTINLCYSKVIFIQYIIEYFFQVSLSSELLFISECESINFTTRYKIHLAIKCFLEIALHLHFSFPSHKRNLDQHINTHHIIQASFYPTYQPLPNHFSFISFFRSYFPSCISLAQSICECLCYYQYFVSLYPGSNWNLICVHN